MDALIPLHWLRPEWLWALLGLPVVYLLWRRTRERRDTWDEVVDPHLLPHLLERRDGMRRNRALFAIAAGYLLAVFALAGPSWREAEQPLWQNRMPLVIALDLSSAMTATDMPPSRLAQARAKLRMLLERRKDGHVALVAFADDAYTVSPLTEDPANVALYLDALRPGIMPVDGHRADRAIAMAQRLLERAGFKRGDIVLITDRASPEAARRAREAAQAGYRVSTLGVGTVAGGNYRRRDGAIAGARLDEAALRELAASGGGRFVRLTQDVDDLATLGVLEPAAGEGASRGRGARVPQDGGYWLLPPLMLLALLAFRRRAGLAVLVLCALWLPRPAQAQATLWQRADQAAHARLLEGNRAYREGDFARAAQLYAELDGAEAHYNRGNALAKAGRYAEAIAAYDAALARRPGMPDAIANRRAVQAMLRKQPPGPKQGQRPGQPDAGRQPSQPGQQGDPQRAQQGEPRSSQDDNDERRQPDTPRTPPPDASAQRAADAAQRARMEQALKQGGPGQQGSPTPQRAPDRDTRVRRERQIANEAWLRRVPDDPGDLLAEKFRIEHERRRLRGEVE